MDLDAGQREYMGAPDDLPRTRAGVNDLPRSQLAVVSILIKEKKQLREAVRRYEAAEERMEKYKNGPYVLSRNAGCGRSELTAAH